MSGKKSSRRLSNFVALLFMIAAILPVLAQSGFPKPLTVSPANVSTGGVGAFAHHADETMRQGKIVLMGIVNVGTLSESSTTSGRFFALPARSQATVSSSSSSQGGVPIWSGKKTVGESYGPQTVSLVNKFDALHFGFNGFGYNGAVPPDVQVAAGPSDVVEMVNLLEGIYTKQGTQLHVVFLSSFFNTGSDYLSDPKILYDASSGRWFASILDLNMSGFKVAISQGTDPSQNWYLYTVSASSGTCTDQPILGISDDKVAIAANDFSHSCNQNGVFLGEEYWVFNKAEMMAGSTVHYVSTGPSGNLFSVHPVKSLSSTATQYFVCTTCGSSSSVELFSLTGVPQGTVTTNTVDISVASFSNPPASVQPGTTKTIDSADNRIQDAVWYQGKLWLSFDVACVPTGDTQSRSCFRLVEIDTSTSSVVQDFDVSGAVGEYYYYPALGIDSGGNLAVVFGYSSASSYPGIIVAGRASVDPVNTLENVFSVLRTGNGSETLSCNSSGVCRYGDYFGAGVDPSNPTGVWVAGEYGSSSGWGTTIGSVSISVMTSTFTLSYSVSGGSGYLAPVFSYVSGGTQHSVSLSTAPTMYTLDPNSHWNVSSSLGGSTVTARWQTPQVTSGIANSSGTVDFLYTYQYLASFNYEVVGGGSGYSPPQITYYSFGSPLHATPDTGVWADSGSHYAYQDPLTGSSPNERWTNASADVAGVVASGPSRFVVNYYHQFMSSAAFEVIGGGTPGAPNLIFVSFASHDSLQLGSSPQSFWADAGSRYSATTNLSGSTSTERWHATINNGTVSSSASLLFDYYHQYYLSIVGAETGSSWYDSGSTAQVSTPSVFGRSGGTGMRIVSYQIDGSVATMITPTAGNVVVDIMMNGPHSLVFNDVTQYEVVLDGGATNALATITPPTISSDNYWYDSGTPVSVVLNGVWGRTSGSGNRLTAVTVNLRLQFGVTTTSTVSAVLLNSISAPQFVSSQVVTQYLLTTSGGSIREITRPPINGDSGWYDSGTIVTILFNHSSNMNSTLSRSNAVGYQIDGGNVISLNRSAAGTFPAQLVMSAPRTVSVNSVVQFSFSVTGGNNLAESSQSPTSDSFYDIDTSLAVTTDYTWGLVNGDMRQNLLSYTFDGQTRSVTRADLGILITPQVTMDRPHVLVFNSIAQYLISFQFKDITGSLAIKPTDLKLVINDQIVVDVSQSRIWLDGGSKFKIASVIFEGVDVKSSNETLFTVSAPLNQVIITMVYDAKILVIDYLSLPISGASISITLANGTSVQMTTASDGTATARLIPLGTFTGTISYLGIATGLSGDASVNPETIARVVVSYPTIMLVIVVIGLSWVVIFDLRRRRDRTVKRRPGGQSLDKIS